MKEKNSLDGRVRIVLRQPGGDIVEERMVHNLITTAGKKLLGGLFSGLAEKPQFQIAVGSSATAASVADTKLGNQVDAATATVSSPRADESNLQQIIVVVSALLPADDKRADQLLTEAGITITLPGQPPVLYNHVTFPLITRTGKLEMTLTWEVIF